MGIERVRKGIPAFRGAPAGLAVVSQGPRRRQAKRGLSRRKEVIQPHFPVRLPCYDFTLLTRRTFDVVPHCWLDKRLRVPPARMV